MECQFSKNDFSKECQYSKNESRLTFWAIKHSCDKMRSSCKLQAWRPQSNTSSWSISVALDGALTQPLAFAVSTCNPFSEERLRPGYAGSSDVQNTREKGNVAAGLAIVEARRLPAKPDGLLHPSCTKFFSIESSYSKQKRRSRRSSP